MTRYLHLSPLRKYKLFALIAQQFPLFNFFLTSIGCRLGVNPRCLLAVTIGLHAGPRTVIFCHSLCRLPNAHTQFRRRWRSACAYKPYSGSLPINYDEIVIHRSTRRDSLVESSRRRQCELNSPSLKTVGDKKKLETEHSHSQEALLCMAEGTETRLSVSKKACSRWMTLTYTQSRHSCCY